MSVATVNIAAPRRSPTEGNRPGEFVSKKNAVANKLRGLSRFKNFERLGDDCISLVVGDEIPFLVYVELGEDFPAEPPELYVAVRSGSERLLLEIGGFASHLSSLDPAGTGLARWPAKNGRPWGARDTVADLLKRWEEALRGPASRARLPGKTGEHYELAVPEEFVRGERAVFKTRRFPPERGASVPLTDRASCEGQGIFDNCAEPLEQSESLRADPTSESNIMEASARGHTAVVRLLLKHADPSAENNHAVIFASSNGHADTVALLLKDKRVDPSARNNLAILSASSNGHADVVALLLEHPLVDPSALNNETIMRASYSGYAKIVALLLQHPRVRRTVKYDEIFEVMNTRNEKEFEGLLLQRSGASPQKTAEVLRFVAEAEIDAEVANGRAEIVRMLTNRRDISF